MDGAEGADAAASATEKPSGISAVPRPRRGRFSLSSQKRNKDHATPGKEKKGKNDKKDKKDKKRKKDKNETKEERRERKKRQRLSKYEDTIQKEGNEEEQVTFEDLFGSASHASASDAENEEPGSSVGPRPPASPAKARAPAFAKQLREEVAKVLRSGLDLQTTTLGQVRASIEKSLNLESGELDEHKELIGNLFQEKIQEMEDSKEKIQEMEDSKDSAKTPADPEMARSPAVATAKAAKRVVPATQESETGKIWTYEVTGRKIGIRKDPSVESDQQGDYIENGELFNVIERRRVSGDVRLYLKLADGRGWAYDRSAKDDGKVVVEELGSKAA